jgi:leucine dehydrogenase
VVAGAANNQLADEQKHGDRLMALGIVYAPDFLINAGGVINCYLEVVGYDAAKAKELTEKIYDRTLEIFARSKADNINSYEAARRIAWERIEAARK